MPPKILVQRGADPVPGGLIWAEDGVQVDTAGEGGQGPCPASGHLLEELPHVIPGRCV